MAQRRSFGSVRRMRGRWQARYHDKAGRRRSRVFATKADANAHLAAVQADIMRGSWFDPEAGSETLAEYADQWLEQRRVKGRPLAQGTRGFYRWQLDKHILPGLGERQLRHLDAAAVRAWWSRVSGPEGAGEIGSAKCYRLLHAICATAVRDELMARNPCALPGAGQESSPERPSVSVPEVYALADAVGERGRAVVLLAAFCGLRWGEIAGLTKDRLDLLHGTVTIAEAKTPAGRRTVAIPDVIMPELRHHVARYAAPDRDGLVFVGPKGAGLSNANWQGRYWRPARETIGRPELHFHDLRGCAATLAAISGATTAELMRRLGHARVDVAMRYQRATAHRDAAVAKAMSDLVRPADVSRLRPTADS